MLVEYFWTQVPESLWTHVGVRAEYYTITQHTHSHTNTCFAILVGTSIDVMVFLLYRPYILSSYTNPTPKLSPHRRLFAFLDFQKTSFFVIYKLVYPWRPQFRSPPWHKSPWVCVYSCLSPHRYIKTHTHTQNTHSHLHSHTHTKHTHSHTHTHTCWFCYTCGDSHRRNGFSTVQTVYSIALHQPYT